MVYLKEAFGVCPLDLQSVKYRQVTRSWNKTEFQLKVDSRLKKCNATFRVENTEERFTDNLVISHLGVRTKVAN